MSYHTFRVFCFTCLHRHYVVHTKPFDVYVIAKRFSKASLQFSSSRSLSLGIPRRKFSLQHSKHLPFIQTLEASQTREKSGRHSEKKKTERKKAKSSPTKEKKKESVGLVIVESPAKAKTIQKFLPERYIVDSCMGHIRNLPESAKEIPDELKKLPWARLGVNVENNFEPIYTISKDKSKVVDHLKELVNSCDELILATDEDREGEAIAWHLVQVLQPKVPYKRAVFHEITKEAIIESFENLRDVHMNLVHAQEARRILDRLVGFTLSPILWKKIAPRLSAGRVQSVALAMIVQRELERITFRQSSFYNIVAKLALSPQYEINEMKEGLTAWLLAFNGKRLATGKDFDPTTGDLKKESIEEGIIHMDLQFAENLLERMMESGVTWKVKSVEKRKLSRKAPVPFITSTLQQESSRRLGFTAGETMRLAQDLYEQGFITYMRTDSPTLSNQAKIAAQKCIVEQFGRDFLQDAASSNNSPKVSKLAQEAHEAIRPAGTSFLSPVQVVNQVSPKHQKLYELIYRRTLASQMKNAEFFVTSVNIDSILEDGSIATFHTSGRTLVFEGYLKAFNEVYGIEENFDDLDDSPLSMHNKNLPALHEGQELYSFHLEPIMHSTKPPPRYTEAALIKALEAEGVGRPSTYASILETLVERKYVHRERINLLNKHFPEVTDPQFTASMEEALDNIANGKADHIEYLRSYFLGEYGLQEKAKEKEKNIDSQEVGPYGPYIELIGNSTKKLNILNEMSPEELCSKTIQELVEERKGKFLGYDPESGHALFLKKGRFGWFLQLVEDNLSPESEGELEMEEEAQKRRVIKNVRLPANVNVESLDLANGLKWLSLPRVLGIDPHTGKEVVASVGPFGPYVGCDGKYISLKSESKERQWF
ncbi:DNA topoisomerase 1 [Galdieria sulphuraria]|nr:DNA topoisomerase 1 [Galdieria sulphuraria]